MSGNFSSFDVHLQLKPFQGADEEVASICNVTQPNFLTFFANNSTTIKRSIFFETNERILTNSVVHMCKKIKLFYEPFTIQFGYAASWKLCWF